MILWMYLLDPESPGMSIWVLRGPLGRFFKPKEFATLGECIKFRNYQYTRD